MADDPDLTGEDVIEEEDEKRKGRAFDRPAASSTRTTATRRPQAEVRLERKLQGGIKQLGEIVGRRDEQLGEILNKDADKMGIMLARVSQTGPKPLKAVIGLVSELLAPLDAFGRTAAHLLAKFREARETRRIEQEWEEEEGDAPAEPWKVS